jgi:hypothetical protein
MFMSEDHIEDLLDEAVEATFPASDPVAIGPREPHECFEDSAE